MQVAVATNAALAPQRSLTARRANFTADPCIEIAAAFKAACKAVDAAQAEMEKCAEAVPADWFTRSGYMCQPHIQVSEADRAAVFGKISPTFCDHEHVDHCFARAAKKLRNDPATLARLPALIADIKSKIDAFNAEREPVIEASGLKKANDDWYAARSEQRTAIAALLATAPTTARGAQAMLGVLTYALTKQDRNGDEVLRLKEVCKIARNVSAFIGGGSR